MESSFTISVDSNVFPPEVSDSIPREFVRCASYSVPRTIASEVVQKIPTFLSFRPLAPGSDVPVIDCRRGDYPKCSSCQAFLSPFCVVNTQVRSWRCPICGHLNSTIHFTSMFDMRVNVTDRQELHHLVYDCLPPKNMLALRGQARVFMFVVDEQLLDPDNPNFSILIQHIESIGKVARDKDQLGLITFGSSVTLVDLNARRGNSFAEFEPSLLNPRKDDWFVTADTGINAIKTCLTALARKPPHGSCVFQAMQWAVDRMRRRGGRLILFTSGTCTDPELPLFDKIWQTAVSVNVFKSSGSLPVIEDWASKTGGIVKSFVSKESLTSLFDTATAWDASSCLRVPPNLKIVKRLGSLFYKDQVEIYPVVMSTQSVMYELRSESLGTGDCCFQLAFRYLDDEGVRKVRVINGKVPYTDIVKLPIDEAALALFLGRTKALEPAEMFTSRVILTRSLRSSEWKLPSLLYNVWTGDNDFLMTCSVERFALSVFVTRMSLFGKSFQVLFAQDVTIVYPKANEDEEEAIKSAMARLGVPFERFWYPEPESEFMSMIPSDAEAERWYSEMKGYALI